MSIETILFLVVIVLIIGAFPTWGHSKEWGYAPTGILTLLLAVFLIWAIAGDRPLFRSSAHNLKDAGRNLSEDIRHAVN